MQSEIIWTLNMKASVAREHRLREYCHKTLQSISHYKHSSSAEIFTKLREHIRCEIQLGSDKKGW